MMAASVLTAFLVCILAKDAISRGVLAIWLPRGCQQPFPARPQPLFHIIVQAYHIAEPRAWSDAKVSPPTSRAPARPRATQDPYGSDWRIFRLVPPRRMRALPPTAESL